MKKPRSRRSSTPRRRFHLTVERCEPRRLLTTFVVTTAADNGSNSSPIAGSLRAEILLSDANPAPIGQTNEITFDIAGPLTIQPLTELPGLGVATVIDGLTQPNTPVVLDGINMDSLEDGLDIYYGNSTVEGLTIDQFPGNAIRLNGDNNQILDDQLGTDPTGETTTSSSGQSLGNGENGIDVGIASHNLIQGNVISGNGYTGIDIDALSSLSDQFSGNNLIVGNRIGTNAAGTKTLPNRGEGIDIEGSSLNTIGGTSPADANIISGNSGSGVAIGNGSAYNLCEGNKIGTDATGTKSLGNAVGVAIGGSLGNTIGGSASGAGNIISGNTENGIEIEGFDNDVYNILGGPNLIASNTIDFNGWNGIDVEAESEGGDPSFYDYPIMLQIQDNLIGTNAQGEAGLGNQQNGILAENVSNLGILNNVVSGSVAGAGIDIERGGSTDIEGDLIGTDLTGTLDLGNHSAGVLLTNSEDPTIYGSVIVGTEAGPGVDIDGTAVDLAFDDRPNYPEVVIIQDHIGTNLAGTAAIPNAGAGLVISSDPSTPFYNAPAVIQADVISGNTGNGLTITNVPNAVIESSMIGTNAAGTVALPNGQAGVVASGTNGLEVLSDVISGNASSGLSVMNSNNIVIDGDDLGVGNDPVTLDGAIPLGNGGVGATVGYSTGLISSNTISSNLSDGSGAGDGLDLSGDLNNETSNPAALVIVDNKIGTDSTGQLALGNQGNGIDVGAMTGLTIANNIVSANSESGIEADGSYGTQIAGNTIGTGVSGSESLPNGGDGIDLENQTQLVSITGNVIVNNRGDGIGIHDVVFGLQANTYIAYNDIGTDYLGSGQGYSTGLGNLGNGIALYGVQGAKVLGNIVASNGLSGIAVFGSSLIYLEANFVGSAPNNASNLGNLGNGIEVMDDGDDLITGNAIGSNGLNGIDLLSALTVTVQGNFIGTDAQGQAASLGNLGDGVLINGTDGAFSSPSLFFNTIVNNRGNGVEVEGLCEVTMSENLIGGVLTAQSSSRPVDSGNGNDGVLVGSLVGEVAMSADVLAENGLHGLQIMSGGSVLSTDDSITGNLGGGVEFDAGATANRLLDDSVVENLAFGILFDLSPGNILSNVIVEDNSGQGLEFVQAVGSGGDGTIGETRNGNDVSLTS